MPLRCIIRVDAAQEIGSGHVMRCLCLAEAMREAGHDCSFLCRRREGDLIETIEARGFDCTILPATEDVLAGTESLGASMAVEIDQSRAVIASEAPDWLIVDHYALDAEWERAVTPASTRVMVVDDLADRPHACNLLLDQGLANRPARYMGLVPDDCRLLLGPAYALLRPEFRQLRSAAEVRERTWPPARLLVNLGGIDIDNATRAVLETLAQSELPNSSVIDVVMGRNAPHVDDVQVCATKSRFAVNVSVDVADMGDRILAADLAIGAAGTTSWERACLGLPSLLLSIAKNQLGVAEALSRSGAALNIGPLWESGWPTRLVAGLTSLSAPGRLAEMSAACLALVDGKGTSRVVEALTALPIDLRPCTMEDAEQVWFWREADGASRYYRSGTPTDWETHRSWFEVALNNMHTALFIVEENGRPVAHLRFDFGGADLPEIGLAVDPERKGLGTGSRVVALAIRHARQARWPGLVAEVSENNVVSARVFERNGFRQVGRDGSFLRYQIKLSQGERV